MCIRDSLHGDLSEFFRLLVHFLLFKRIRLIDFESGEPLQIFKESVAQFRILCLLYTSCCSQLVKYPPWEVKC